MVVGTCLAHVIRGEVNWMLMWSAIVSVLCIQIGTNLINDALDFKKGADTAERLGPQRVTQSGLLSFRNVYRAGIFFFALALVAAIPLFIQGGLAILGLVVVAALCGYGYTGGPCPLAYLGLGELFVILFYGFAAVCSLYYLQTGTIDMAAILASLQFGMLATVPIAINNLRDYAGDAKANKRTLAVRFGTAFATAEITFLILIPFVLNILWLTFGLTMAAAAPLIALPLALFLVQFVMKHEPGPIYNKFLCLSVFLDIAFGTLLVFGFYVS
jgi:1,4-dihydroxy-2-naphthoate polyprenyltransferase